MPLNLHYTVAKHLAMHVHILHVCTHCISELMITAARTQDKIQSKFDEHPTKHHAISYFLKRSEHLSMVIISPVYGSFVPCRTSTGRWR